jgi:hypothetical protein
MLISLLAILVMAASAALREAVADVPVVLEGPSTLELALIGGGILVVYAVATRAIGRRRARISSEAVASQLAITPSHEATVEAGTEQEPSRGAA